MSPLIEITSLGAFVPGDEERPARYVRRGVSVDVSDENAERLIARGHAKPAGEDVATEQEVTTNPASDAAPDIDTATLKALRDYAKANDIAIPAAARRRDDVADAIRTALAARVDAPPTDEQRAARLAGPLGDDDTELGDELPEDLASLTDGQLRLLAAEMDVELPADVTVGAAIAALEEKEQDDGQ